MRRSEYPHGMWKPLRRQQNLITQSIKWKVWRSKLWEAMKCAGHRMTTVDHGSWGLLLVITCPLLIAFLFWQSSSFSSPFLIASRISFLHDVWGLHYLLLFVRLLYKILLHCPPYVYDYNISIIYSLLFRFGYGPIEIF